MLHHAIFYQKGRICCRKNIIDQFRNRTNRKVYEESLYEMKTNSYETALKSTVTTTKHLNHKSCSVENSPGLRQKISKTIIKYQKGAREKKRNN